MRFPAPEQMPAPPQPVAAIGPVVFSVRFDGREHHYDLSDLPCPRLVRHLARALTAVAGEGGTQRTQGSLHLTVGWVRRLVCFAAAANPDSAADFDLADLTPQLLEDFEDALLAQYGPDSRQPYTQIVCLLRLLRMAQEEHPEAFGIEMQTRLGFSTVTARQVDRPLDSYPLPVFDAIQAAAVADVRRIRDRILDGERLVRAGEDPDVAGWEKLENVLWHIANRGPLTPAHQRRPGLRRKLWILGGIRALNGRLLVTYADLVPFLVLLICLTGLEPESAKALRADCLVNPARGFVGVAYVKNRSRGRSHKTMRVSDGGALHFPGGVLRLALRLTQRGREYVGTDRLWADVVDYGVRVSFATTRTMGLVMEAWMARHGLDTLTDRGGGPVRLDLRRLRKTYKSRRYLQSAGVLDDFADGHSKQVAAGHYANIDAHREIHDNAVEDGLREALDAALAAPVVLDDTGARLDDGAGRLEPDEVSAALGQQQDVWLASCRDFYASPYAIRKGAGCPVAVWGCLECPNAVFTTRHLPSILSFLAFVEQQRDVLAMAEWKVRYGLAWERIVTGIRPKFSNEQVVTAQAIAEAGGPRLALPARFLEHTL